MKTRTVHVLAFTSFCLLTPSCAFSWLNAFQHGGSLSACLGNNFTFPTAFRLAAGERLAASSLSRTPLRNNRPRPQEILMNAGVKATNDSRLTVLNSSAQVEISAVSDNDAGNYTLDVSVLSGRRRVNYTSTVRLVVVQGPVLSSTSLQASLVPRAVKNGSTWSASFALSCGRFDSLGQPPVSVIWRTASYFGNVYSTVYKDGDFYLNLPGETRPGRYSCELDPNAPATHCFVSLSEKGQKAVSSKTRATIQIHGLKSQFDNPEAAFTELDKMFASLTTNNTNNIVDKHITALTTQLDKLQTQQSDLQKKTNEALLHLASVADKVDDTNGDHVETDTRVREVLVITELLGQLRHLQTNMSTLENKSNLSYTRTAKAPTLKTALSVTRETATLNTSMTMLLTSVSFLDATVSVLQAMIDGTETRRDTLANNTKTLEELIARMERQQAGWRTRNFQLEVLLNWLRDLNADLNEENTKLDASINATEQQYSLLEALVKKLMSRLEQQEARANELSVLVNQSEARTSAVMAQRSQLEQHLKTADSHLHSSHADLQRRVTQIQAQNAGIEQIEQQLDRRLNEYRSPPSLHLENAALLKSATQSSTYKNEMRVILAASKAVDGHVSVSSSSYCTHTQNSDSDSAPWWRVDLGGLCKIYAVDIVNRADCCSERLHQFDIEVMTEDRDWDSQTKPAVLCNTYAGIPPGGVKQRIYCQRPIVGRHVKIRKRSKALTLCEVEVMALRSASCIIKSMKKKKTTSALSRVEAALDWTKT